MPQKSTFNGIRVESETFGVDLGRLAFVIIMGQPEPMMDGPDGDQIKGPTGILKWQVEAACPGMRIGGATGAAPVRVRIESATAPRVESYKPYSLIGPSFLTGSVVGDRNARRAQLSLSGTALRAFTGEIGSVVASHLAGVPISIEGDAPTMFITASVPRNGYSGDPITLNGQPVMRIQVVAPRIFERKDGKGVFVRNDGLFVDVLRDVWDRKPIAPMAAMEFVGLRCDAYANPMTDRVSMGLFAAGYRAVVAPAVAAPKPAPKVPETAAT